MNQFKRELHQELQSISLSDEKKQSIAMKAKASMHRSKRQIHWQYRFVLTAFTILSLSFGYMLLTQNDSGGKSQGVAPIEPITTNESIWGHDFLKVILLIGFFVILRTIIKKRLQKKGQGLPVCLACSEEWTFREASKQSWKNGEVTCPYCAHKQYRTKKSSRKMVLLNIPIIFMVMVSNLFDLGLLGIVIYLFCAVYFIFSLNPYFMELQEKDPFNETLY